MQTNYSPNRSFMRVATATPPVAIGDIESNIREIATLYNKSCDHLVSIVVFPELAITGYSLGDTVRQQPLLQRAVHGLTTLAKSTKNMPTAMVVGLPYQHQSRLYNCAALLADGEIKGIVTKSNLPNYDEFYDQRWYQPFYGTTNTRIKSHDIIFGQNI